MQIQNTVNRIEKLECVGRSYRGYDRKADSLWQDIIRNKPTNVGNGPHDTRCDSWQNDPWVDVWSVAHDGTVHYHVESAGGENATEMGEHIVQTWNKRNVCYCKIFHNLGPTEPKLMQFKNCILFSTVVHKRRTVFCCKLFFKCMTQYRICITGPCELEFAFNSNRLKMRQKWFAIAVKTARWLAFHVCRLVSNSMKSYHTPTRHTQIKTFF